MKELALAVSVAVTAGASAYAGGLDRSGQPVGIIFEDGNVLEFSLGYTDPSVDGVDTTVTPFNPAGSNPIGNVGDSFLIWGSALKYDVTDSFSLAIIADEPYGSDVLYPGDPATSALGGTTAIVDSNALTAVGRYKINDNFSAFAGVRYQAISASVRLGGLAYGGLNGYNVNFGSDSEVGYLVGVAYEIPDIALRVALTYNSEIEHSNPTEEFVGTTLVSTGTTTIVAPESLNLEFQSGIAANTLLFGSIRYARYSDTIVSPAFFDASVPGANSSLTDVEDGTDYELGIGRRFNDKWSGQIAIGYESSGDDNLVSPLAPTNGASYVTLGAAYKVNDRMTISGGVRYTDLGDALPETGTPDVARANFSDNSALSFGLRVQYRF